MVHIDPIEVAIDLEHLADLLFDYYEHINHVYNLLYSTTLYELFSEDDYEHIEDMISQLEDDAAILSNLGDAAHWAFKRWIRDPVLNSEDLDKSIAWNADMRTDIQKHLTTLENLELYTPQHLPQASPVLKEAYSEYTSELFNAKDLLNLSLLKCVDVYPNMLSFARPRVIRVLFQILRNLKLNFSAMNLLHKCQ